VNDFCVEESPQIISFIIWQLLLFYILLVRLARCLKEKKNNKDELWILLILFSYFIVQGLFEPDLGSAVRHKIGVFPIIYYALYYDYFRKNI
jgi:cell division protein FtsW (lipid II flippase)